MPRPSIIALRSPPAGENRDRKLGIRIETLERLDEPLRRLGVNGVSDVQPVDRDNRDRASGLIAHCHLFLLLGSS